MNVVAAGTQAASRCVFYKEEVKIVALFKGKKKKVTSSKKPQNLSLLLLPEPLREAHKKNPTATSWHCFQNRTSGTWKIIPTNE